MLIDNDQSRPIYIIGDSPLSREMATWVRAEHLGEVIEVSHIDKDKIPKNSQCILGFMNIFHRTKLLQSNWHLSHDWPSYRHPMSLVESTVRLGRGHFVCPVSTVLHHVLIKDFFFIASHSHVSHGCKLGSNVAVAPGVMLAGSSSIGNHVFFGQASVVADKLCIADQVSFSMASVVTKDIVNSGKYCHNKRIGNFSDDDGLLEMGHVNV